MHITRYTDYSLRVLIYLAAQPDDALSTIAAIAQSYDISKNHLMKIVQALNTQGYVQTVRGKFGGLRLARAPADINLGNIVRQFEQGSPLVECFGEGNQCLITPACQLKNIFAQAMEQFFSELDQYTLADLVPTQQKIPLQAIFAIAK